MFVWLCFLLVGVLLPLTRLLEGKIDSYWEGGPIPPYGVVEGSLYRRWGGSTQYIFKLYPITLYKPIGIAKGNLLAHIKGALHYSTQLVLRQTCYHDTI